MNSPTTLLLICLISTLIFTLILYWIGFGYFTSFVIGLTVATLAITCFWDGLYDEREEASAAFLTSLIYFSYFLINVWFILTIICTLYLLLGGTLNRNRLTDALYNFGDN